MAEVTLKSQEQMQRQLQGFRNRKANFISVISLSSAGSSALYRLTLEGG